METHICAKMKISDKITYLSNNVKWHFHEIIGHLNVRFNYYLYKKKAISLLSLRNHPFLQMVGVAMNLENMWKK